MADIPGNTSTTSQITGSGTFYGALELINDSDWWRLSLKAGLTYTFKVTGDGSANTLDDADFTLRDSLGNSIRSVPDGQTISVTPSADGIFYLDGSDGGIYDQLAEGNYVITSWMGDTIRNNVTTSAAITTSGTTAGDLAQSLDSDWYKLSLVAGRSYSFQMVGDGSVSSLDDGQLVLRDANGNSIKSVTDGTILSFTAASSGRYFLEAADGGIYDGLGEGNYVIRSSLSDTISANASTTAVITAGHELIGRIDAAQDSDWYRLSTQTGVTYELRLSGTGAAGLSDNRVFLLDSNGNRIDYDRGYSGDAALLTFQATSAGPYYVAVRSSSDYDTRTGDFLLGVRSNSRTVVGTNGNDTLSGMDNSNVIYGGLGNDSLRGYGGNDILNGGWGNDILSGGSGFDIADYSGNTAVSVDMNKAALQNTNMGFDRLMSIEGVRGGNGNDKLAGNAGANRLEGGAGNDVVYGSHGGDTLLGGMGNDTINGASGFDTLLFVAGNSARSVNLGLVRAQNTGEGFDVITGIESVVSDNGDDRLTGSNFSNRIDGGGGNDWLHGAGGNDTMIGGLGNDTINGGFGTDILIFDTDASVAVDLARTTAQFTGEGRDIILGIENVQGDDGNDRFLGTNGVNMLDGDDGNDLLDGRGGADRLLGDDGRDTLRGGTGNDFLTGGDDEDVFYFDAGGGVDRITDFDDGDDLIEFHSGANAMSDLSFAQVGSATHITYGGGVVVVENTYYYYLDASDFVFS